MESRRLHSETPSALPIGTRLGEFEVLSLLGVGGFGIVYLAFDHALEREVAVKEYMPAALAGRTETMYVSLLSQNDADTFALGLRSFVNEARLLARFDHPSLLKVHRFWEANGTAYMAMPVMRGRTVKDIRHEMVGPPDEAWLRGVLEPLLGAIEKLHSEGVYHRDIAPDNIQIEPGGRPVLLDFGAARRVLSDKSQTLTAILKPAYAPIEQYAEAGAVKQGPWTDIYALGATLHYLLLQRPPPPATTRAVHDDASALTAERLPGCSATFLNTIDWMLAPRPADRPRSVAALREVLEGRAAPPVRRAPEPTASSWERTVMLPSAEPVTLVVPRTGVPVSVTNPLQPAPMTPVPMTPVPPSPAPAARPRTLLSLALGGAALLVVAAAAALLWPRAALQPVEMVEVVEPAPAPAAAASVPAPAPAPAMAMVTASAPAESAIATVTLPGTGGAGPSALPPVITEAAAPPARQPAAMRQPVPRSSASPADVPVVAALPQARPTAALPQAEAPRAPVPAVAVPPQAPAAEAGRQAAGPEARCAGRSVLSNIVCMERECLRSEFAAHGDCLKWRKDAKRE